MNILALDTTMRACSAAVMRDATGEAASFRRFEERERGHAEAIMPMIGAVMAEAGLDFTALDRIAVTVGPGTFTGVRVGVAAARGLALATGAAMVGVTSLAAIARGVSDDRPEGEHIVAVAADARRGQVYFALYDGRGTVLCDPAAISPAEVAGLLPASGTVILAGSGAALVAEAAHAGKRCFDAVLERLQPDAATVAVMGSVAVAAAGPVSPLYLRAPDARPQTGKAVPHL